MTPTGLLLYEPTKWNEALLSTLPTFPKNKKMLLPRIKYIHVFDFQFHCTIVEIRLSEPYPPVDQITSIKGNSEKKFRHILPKFLILQRKLSPRKK